MCRRKKAEDECGIKPIKKPRHRAGLSGALTQRCLQASGLAQLCRFVGFFPWEMFAAKVTVSSRFFIDWVQQIQHLNQTVWTQIKEFTDQQRQLFSRDFSVPKVSTMIDVGSATPMA